MTFQTINNNRHHNFNNQICAVVVLSIVLMIHGACGRQNMGAVGTSYLALSHPADMSQVLLNELLTNTNDNELYSELKYHRQQPNYLAKWPGLRDLLLTADYEDTGADNTIDNESNEAAINSRFMERLRQLAASTVEDMEDAREESAPEPMPTPMPLNKLSPASLGNSKVTFKDHGTKKNVQSRKQYMSPCHFKICNMGRKRNARFFGNN